MKLLAIMLAFVTVTAQAAPSDFLGGVLKARNGGVTTKWYLLRAMKCESRDSTGTCQVYGVYRKQSHIDEPFKKSFEVRPDELDRWVERASRRSRLIKKRRYKEAYFLASGRALGVCVFSGGGCVLLFPAVGVDFVKAPFVGVAHAGSSVRDLFIDKRMKRYIRYMLNPKKKNKSKKVSFRDMIGLGSGV